MLKFDANLKNQLLIVHIEKCFEDFDLISHVFYFYLREYNDKSKANIRYQFLKRNVSSLFFFVVICYSKQAIKHSVETYTIVLKSNILWSLGEFLTKYFVYAYIRISRIILSAIFTSIQENFKQFPTNLSLIYVRP